MALTSQILNTEIYLNFITDVSTPKQMTLHEIKQETQKDSVLKALARAIKENDWNNDIVKFYSAMKHEFCEHNSIILRENRIVLPHILQKKAIKIIHEGHLGIQKVKELLRTKVYWKNMDKDITEEIGKCIACQAVSGEASPTPIKFSELPSSPWYEISLDFL